MWLELMILSLFCDKFYLFLGAKVVLVGFPIQKISGRHLLSPKDEPNIRADTIWLLNYSNSIARNAHRKACQMPKGLASAQ
jgi:hypothetical protein